MDTHEQVWRQVLIEGHEPQVVLGQDLYPAVAESFPAARSRQLSLRGRAEPVHAVKSVSMLASKR